MRAARQVAILDKNGDHLRYIARSEAHKMVGTGEATYICRNCDTPDAHQRTCEGRVKPHSMVYVATALYRNIHISNCSITFREVMANAGVDGSSGVMRAARIKVANWDPTAMRRELYTCPA